MALKNSIILVNMNDSDDSFRQKVNKNFLAVQDAQRQLSEADVTGIAKRVVETSTTDVYTQLFDLIYPIGSVIWTSSLSDARLQRGTWAQLQGVFLLAADTSHPSGSSGGGQEVQITSEVIKDDFRLSSGNDTYELVTDVKVAGSVDDEVVPYAARYCFERTA